MTTYYQYTMRVWLQNDRVENYYPVARTAFGAWRMTVRHYRASGIKRVWLEERRQYVTV